MSNYKKNKLTAKQKRDEAVSNRILIILAATFVLIFCLSFANRYYRLAGYMKSTRDVLYVLAVLGAAGLVAGIIMLFTLGRGDRIKRSVVISLNVAGLSLFLGLSCLFMVKYYLRGVSIMFFMIPAIAILYLVYYVYQREFFNIAVICAGGGAMLWIMSQVNIVSFGYSAAALIISLALLIIHAAFLYLLKKRNGVISFRGQNFVCMAKTADYRPVFITGGAAFVLIILGFLLGTMFSFIAMWVIFAYLFVMAVYYTVKLM